MAVLSCDPYGTNFKYGDGTKYCKVFGTIPWITEDEPSPSQLFRISFKIKFSGENFYASGLYANINERYDPGSQYIAEVDLVKQTRVSLKLKVSGTEFESMGMRVDAQRKKHQPKG